MLKLQELKCVQNEQMRGGIVSAETAGLKNWGRVCAQSKRLRRELAVASPVMNGARHRNPSAADDNIVDTSNQVKYGRFRILFLRKPSRLEVSGRICCRRMRLLGRRVSAEMGRCVAG